MTLILDIAAGVLIAAAIVGVVVLGVQATMAEEARTGGGARGSLVALLGVLLWIAFVVCRLLRWP